MDTLNGLLSNFGAFLQSILPVSPFADFFDQWVAPQYLSWLNWFFPVSECITVLGVWISAVTVYMLYSVLMRWVRVID